MDKTILISRTDSIGDVVLTLPLASYIKKNYPESRIIFLGKTYTQPIIKSCPDINEFLDWSILEKRDDKDLVSLLKKVDIFIHVFPNKRLAKLAKKAKIQTRIGTSHRIFHWITCNQKPRFSRKKSSLHESQLNFELLRPILGNFPIPSLCEIYETLQFHAPKSQFTLDQRLSSQKFKLIIHPRSQGSAVEWGANNFKELISKLDPQKFQIIITGTKAEKQYIDDNIMPSPADHILDFVGKISLSQLITLISQCNGLVAASTGPLHIAGVLGLHTLGLYSNKEPIHPGRWKPLGKNVEILTATDHPDKYKDPVKEIQSIAPNRVIDHFNQFLLPGSS